jgi:hypothetical protein
MKIKICRRVILSVVLRGCETWSFTLREEHRLRVFENRVLRKLFRPKRDAITGEWRKLHNDVLCTPPNIIRMIKSRRMRLAGHVARMGDRRGAYMVLASKPKRRRPLGRSRRRWKDNIKMDLKEVEWKS